MKTSKIGLNESLGFYNKKTPEGALFIIGARYFASIGLIFMKNISSWDISWSCFGAEQNKKACERENNMIPYLQIVFWVAK